MLAKHKHANIPTSKSRFPPLQCHGFDGGTYPTPGSFFARGWTRPPLKGFIGINKLKERISYFFSIDVPAPMGHKIMVPDALWGTVP